jgi:streptogramin lyase
VYRIDAATGQVVARVPVPEGSETLAASAGAAWVVSQPYGSAAATIERIDARSFGLTVAGRAPGDVMAATDSALWLISEDQLTRIDPVRRTVVATVPIPGSPSAVVVTPNGPWVLHGLGNTAGSAVSHIDDQTNTITTTIPIPGDGTAGMVYGHDAVWVDEGADNQAVRVDTSSGQVTVVPLEQPNAMTTSDSYLWVASHVVATGTIPDVPPRQLAKPSFTDNLTLIDITQHPLVTGVLDLAAFVPDGLVGSQVPIAADPSSVWIASGSDLLHIQPRK